MANSKPHRLPSAAKHMRADARKRAYNRARKVKVRDSEKSLNAIIAAGDKGAKTGVIHKNKADRKKARLAARVAKMA